VIWRAAQLSLVLATGAWAQAPGSEFERYLVAATRMLEATEFEKALSQLMRARMLISNSDQEVRLELLEGVVQGELGNTEKARRAFRAGLALELNAELPVKVSMRLKALFLAVREELSRVPVSQPTRPPVSDVPVLEPPPPSLAPRASPPARVVAGLEAPRRSRVAPVLALAGAMAVGVFSGISASLSHSRALAVERAFYNSDGRALAADANRWANVSLACAIAAASLAALGVALFGLAQ
jgi:hypothetical protein